MREGEGGREEGGRERGHSESARSACTHSLTLTQALCLVPRARSLALETVLRCRSLFRDALKTPFWRLNALALARSLTYFLTHFTSPPSPPSHLGVSTDIRTYDTCKHRQKKPLSLGIKNPTASSQQGHCLVTRLLCASRVWTCSLSVGFHLSPFRRFSFWCSFSAFSETSTSIAKPEFFFCYFFFILSGFCWFC